MRLENFSDLIKKTCNPERKKYYEETFGNKK
jgi:hypothetical protein